jgi:hypothetical protein
VRQYVSGYRCPLHTPAAIAGEPEPGVIAEQHRAAVALLADHLAAEPVGTWPPGCGGPCARCSATHHRYGPGGRPLCANCRGGQ